MVNGKKETLQKGSKWKCALKECGKEITEGQERFYEKLDSGWISACCLDHFTKLGGVLSEDGGKKKFYPAPRTLDQKIADVKGFHEFITSLKKTPEGTPKVKTIEFDPTISIEYYQILATVFNGSSR